MEPDVPQAEQADRGVPLGSWAILSGLVLLVALFCVQILLDRQNTLDRNGRWSSAKVELDYGVIGAVATMVTRPPLAGSRLDLGSYHGFQEMWLNEEGSARTLAFAVRSDEPAYLDLLLGRDRKDAAGVRLSFHPDFAGLRFRSTDGEFNESEKLTSLSDLELGKWHAVAVKIDENEVHLEIEGGPSLALAWPFSTVHAIGFRGSMLGPLLDDVDVGFEASPVLHESFSNREGGPQVAATVFVIAGALIAVTFVLLVRRFGGDRRRAYFVCLLGSLVAVICIAMLSTADRFYLAHLHPEHYGTLKDSRYPNRIELLQQAIDRLEREIDALGPKTRDRILVVGSSQTWGAGASTREATWPSVFERELAARGRDFEVINTGTAGGRATELFRLFQHDWLEAKPDLVIVNLGHNDRDRERFGRAMSSFATLCRVEGLPLVFVLEANATEAPTRIGERHEVMRRLAEGREQVHVIDMHGYLDGQRETGHLWWDSVHLTDYGHRLFGRELARQLDEILGR